MKFDELKEKIQGVYAIMVTPMKEDYSLDLEKLRSNTRFLIENRMREGTAILVPVGAGGEGYHLTPEELLLAARTVIEAAEGEVPVFPGCTITGTFASREICRQYQEIGADGVQLSPPYYYEPSEQEYLEHYRLCSEAAPNLGIIAYNSWWNSNFDVTPETLQKLAEMPNIVGIKWSSANNANYQRGLNELKDRFSFVDNQITGIGTLGFMLGARSFVSSIPNFVPQYDLELWELLERRDWNGAMAKMQQFVIPLYRFLGQMHQQGVHGEGSHWKACCDVGGRPMGPPRPPHRPYTSEEKLRLKEVFDQCGMLSS